jgi:hypothetical protein
MHGTMNIKYNIPVNHIKRARTSIEYIIVTVDDIGRRSARGKRKISTFKVNIKITQSLKLLVETNTATSRLHRRRTAEFLLGRKWLSYSFCQDDIIFIQNRIMFTSKPTGKGYRNKLWYPFEAGKIISA